MASDFGPRNRPLWDGGRSQEQERRVLSALSAGAADDGDERTRVASSMGNSVRSTVRNVLYSYRAFRNNVTVRFSAWGDRGSWYAGTAVTTAARVVPAGVCVVASVFLADLRISPDDLRTLKKLEALSARGMSPTTDASPRESALWHV